MRDVLFLQPAYPPEMQQFVRGLAQSGARVWGVGDSGRQSLPDSLTRHLSGYLQVPGILREQDVIQRIERWLGSRRPDLVEGAWEPVIQLAAQLRERWGLPGMSVDTVLGFRDKRTMHERISRAGLLTARSHRVQNLPQAWAAAEDLGYPLVLKPTDGAGGADTHICSSPQELDHALRQTRHVAELVIEAFVSGEEFTFEALSVRGSPVFHSVCRYEPNVLDARKNEWISPIICCLRDLHEPRLQDGIRLGHRALQALGMGSGMSHMEWFRQPDDRAIFGEVACRPPGSKMLDLMNTAWDTDLYRAWGMSILGKPPQLPTRSPYNAAIIFKRAHGQGRIRAIHGVSEFIRAHRPHIARIDLLPIGARRRDWRATFIADGNIIVRHPDLEVTMALAREAARTIHLVAT